jgi:hypothetical protein
MKAALSTILSLFVIYGATIPIPLGLQKDATAFPTENVGVGSNLAVPTLGLPGAVVSKVHIYSNRTKINPRRFSHEA